MLLELMTFAALVGSVPSAPSAGTDCGMQVCLYASAESGSTWKAGQRLSRGKRRQDAKKNKKRKAVGLSVSLSEGRGSVFIDGRYLATTGPHAQRTLKPGKHELEVRDGDETLAVGVLVVSRKAGSLLVVIDPTRG